MGFFKSIIESGHYADYNLAFLAEIEIEARVIFKKRYTDADDLGKMEHDELKSLLPRIDLLKITGKYDTFRDELRNIDSVKNGPLSNLAKGWREAYKLFSHPDVWNALYGRTSPDPAQRERFQNLFDDHIGDKSPRELQTLLSCLERAKLPKGRTRLATPWANVIIHMDAMRLAVAGGASVAEASKVQAGTERMAGDAERARTLAKLYRQKMTLRE